MPEMGRAAKGRRSHNILELKTDDEKIAGDDRVQSKKIRQGTERRRSNMGRKYAHRVRDAIGIGRNRICRMTERARRRDHRNSNRRRWIA